MSKNFSAPMSAPKPGLRADDVVRGEGEPVGQDRVVAVGDVAERTAVDERRAAFERLEQVRLERVAQQDGHRAGDLEVLGRDGIAGRRRGEDDPPEPRPQVVQVGREGEDRHDLRRDGDLPLRSRAAGPFSLPPRPTTTLRIARSLMSTTRGQTIDDGSMPSGFSWWRWLSRNAAARLWAAPIAWLSPVRWRLKSSIGMTWL